MATIEFQIIPSKLLRYYLHSIYIFAAMTIIFLTTTLILKTIFFFVLAGFWYKESRIYQKNNKPLRLWHEKDKIFTIETPNGQQITGQLKGDSYKCPWFIIIRLQSGKSISKNLGKKSLTKARVAKSRSARTITIFIAKDSLSEFEYRLLSCRLLSF